MTANTLAVPMEAQGSAAPDAIEIREAVQADNQALLELTRMTPMAGNISLRIDRDPDFFALPRARGETVVFVATCEGKVIGCMSASIHAAYIDGAIENVAHATDLKVHPGLHRQAPGCVHGLSRPLRTISGAEGSISPSTLLPTATRE